MIGRIFTVGGLTLVSRLTGFARDIVLAAVLGAGPVADAFFVALRLPNHFRAIFAEGAFNAAFVPAYARIRKQSGADGAGIFADRVFTLLLASQVVLLAAALAHDPGLEARARALSQELRCLVCQNQSIDESNADLAHDLRVLLRQRLAAGDSDRQILDYVTTRYGMFVLLDPPFAPVTWLLWLAPPVLVLGGGGALLLRARRRRADQAIPELTREESARAALLLGDRR